MLYLYIHLATFVRANSYNRLVHIAQYFQLLELHGYVAIATCFLTFYCNPYFLIQIQNFCLYVSCINESNKKIKKFA